MAGWHHRLNGHEFEQTLEVIEGQGTLVCCSSQGRRVRCNLVIEQRYARINGQGMIRKQSLNWGYCCPVAQSCLTLCDPRG